MMTPVTSFYLKRVEHTFWGRSSALVRAGQRGRSAMTIAYDAGDFNELTVLLRWRGTIMPAVLCRPVMWMLLAAHVGFLYLHVYRPDIHMPTLP